MFLKIIRAWHLDGIFICFSFGVLNKVRNWLPLPVYGKIISNPNFIQIVDLLNSILLLLVYICEWCLWVYVFFSKHMCMGVHLHTYAYCMKARDLQRYYNCSLSCFLRQYLSLSMGLTDWLRLTASKLWRSICLSAPRIGVIDTHCSV